MAKPILGRNSELFKALSVAGLADDQTRRVVIDIPVNGLVIAYVEKYVDSRVIQVITTLEGIKIESIDDLEDKDEQSV